jgi:NAD(P)-dependent dehydrogenase (short-subunit alcohol dehydrogenase family)
MRDKASDKFRFDGLTAVITGAGRGLGREFATLLARRGAAVVVNDIGVSADSGRYSVDPFGVDLARDAERHDVADAVAAEIRATGGKAAADHGDVSDPAQARALIDTALDRFGSVDIVVNNAGVIVTRPVDELTAADLDAVYRVHVLGSFSVLQAAWPLFVSQDCGRVVNVGSVEGGLIGTPTFAVYAAAKGALVGMTYALAAEGAGAGITINGLLPAAATRASSKSLIHNKSGNIERSAAVVAPAAAWLCHPACDVSGQLFASTAGSIRRVYTSAVLGYQSPEPERFSIEELRDNWAIALDRTAPFVPATGAEYSAFREAGHPGRILA